jgi:hypothetical protein
MRCPQKLDFISQNKTHDVGVNVGANVGRNVGTNEDKVIMLLRQNCSSWSKQKWILGGSLKNRMCSEMNNKNAAATTGGISTRCWIDRTS